VPVGIDHAFLGQCPVGNDEILDQAHAAPFRRVRRLSE
jgi:hypothetical protein